jgi:hypothetical protein
MRAALALALAVGVLGAPARGQAQSTRIGVLAGPRTNMGVLGNRYAIGMMGGVEAALMAGWLGVVWSLSYSRFPSSDPRNVEDLLELWDLDFGLRARLALRPDGPFFLWGQLGVDLMRASVPLEPELQVSYFGPTVRVGGELVLGRIILALGADYGLVTGGPSGLRLLFFAGLGG